MTASLSRLAPVSALDVAAALVGSIAPDLIEKSARLKHRNRAVHNFLTALAGGGLALLALPPLAPFWLGYTHHLVLDLTRGGVYAGKRRVSGPLEAGNPIHNVLVVAIHAIPLLF
ncbi:MAG: hypothetical protein DRP11_04350 [Candidatus Aenigmatarchaeota archaeon]|nr:MAG: hypothetical protein DRP11_04350 [Candidatus Aenigmarchaeota archaeon]